ncbi:serine/threonine protein phosphatase [Fischerella thermalis CCMEE 5268]|uniref:Serine/threonine protein phosphatase n=1 Tax=Fischerella thermalis CCMEE 5268 TaxID=2019662 RepID=A0A2N6KME2_9CYAN|nr:serine/threonine phosphatase [Fischerella thermalis]PMB01087.1 serine/threonine protein phosphatase [Fischerella thermalis CCMEE 5268]
MLICPQCKFENPMSNKFCQKCGASLTHKSCPHCDTQVPVDAQQCHNCGAECGRIWWAIITKIGDFNESEKEIGGSEESGSVSTSPPQVVSVSASTLSLLPEYPYLDQQKRYQLLEPLPNLGDVAPHTQVYVRVLDCLPYQVSPLEAMIANQYQGLVTPAMEASGVPVSAQAYFALAAYTHQGIPPIHDAWQNENIQVVLIEDRSDWKYLLDLWRDESTSCLQMINCFYQMTQLWALLEPLNCCHSLLDLSNLRLDEDQAVALQMLYGSPFQRSSTGNMLTHEENNTPEQVENVLNIQALAQVWHKLFRESQRTQFGSLLQLLTDLEAGKIDNLLNLQSGLQAIATELQPTSSFDDSDVTATVDLATNSPTILQLGEPQEDNVSKNDDMPTVVLPMQLISLEHAGLTDVGRQRHHNEDYFGIDTKITRLELPTSRNVQARALYILCDGMGGHAGGEVASALAVNTVQQYFQTHWVDNKLPTEEQIREAVGRANQAIYNINQKDARSGVGRMGTTLVMLLIQDTQAAVAHVGDSRLYRLTRKGGLEQITVDHEVGQREISQGVEPSVAYNRPDAYQLTQALGPRDEHSISADVQFLDIAEDTLFILASDGLSDNDLLETHYSTHLLPLLSSGANLETGVRDLIDLANDYNGHDNITIVLIRAKVRPNLDAQNLVNG